MEFNLVYCIYLATFFGHKLDWFKTVLSIHYQDMAMVYLSKVRYSFSAEY